MSIQTVQVRIVKGQFITKRGKKITIVDFADVKQFSFQEDVWKLIKEYMLDDTRFVFDVLSKHRKNDYERLEECTRNFSKRHDMWANVYFQIKHQFEPFMRLWFELSFESLDCDWSAECIESLALVREMHKMMEWGNLEKIWSKLDEMEENFKYLGGVPTRVFLNDLYKQRYNKDFEKCVYPIVDIEAHF
jgi:hypothetical protein